MMHPKFGELIPAKDVCKMTGHTMNQLRNWRIPARLHLAPFGYVAIGATAYYRKVVVEHYVKENGFSHDSYRTTAFDLKFPLENGEYLTEVKSNV